jgi:hypothetical protein
MRNVRLPLLLLACLLVLPAAVPLRAAAQSRDLDTYVLFALKELRTKGLTLSSGDVGVNQPEGLLSASSHGVIDAPQSQLVAEIVRMSARSRCALQFANVYREACGPASAMEPLPIIADPVHACGFPSAFPACSTDPRKDQMVADGQRILLPPGTYGNVRVLGGGKLVLSGGSYVFCSLRAGRNAQVLVQHAATVNVTGLVNLSNTVFFGPDASVVPSISARDIQLFANGSLVHFSGSADVHARLCAPSAVLRLTHGGHVEGTFVAGTIRTERITGGLPGGGPGSSTTTTMPAATSTTSTSRPAGSSTTTTTLPDCDALCGNSHIDPVCHEECDVNDFGGATCPGSSTPGEFLECNNDCSIDFAKCPCGDGVKDPSEECDPTASPTGCPIGQQCGTTDSGDACRCVTTVKEICGNCIDDDGNGDTDFEDVACCPRQQTFAMTIRRGRLRPRGAATKLRLRSILAQAGLEKVNPLKQDVFLQIRTPHGPDLLCAKVPASKFMRMHKAFKFWDRKHRVQSAKGIDDMTVRVRKNRSVRLRTVGKRVQCQVPRGDRLQVTVGFHDPVSDAQNSCSSHVQVFRVRPSGRMIAP